MASTAILLTWLATLGMLLATISDPPLENKGNHAVRSATITLNGDISKVFPLFGFLEEKKWSRGWDPQTVAIGSTLQDSVFTVSHDGLTATWIVAEWDETNHVAVYALFVPNDRAMTIRVVCTSDGERTRAQVTYTFISLGEQGTVALRHFEKQDFARRILHWEHAINHYLATGTQWPGDSH